MDNIDVRTMSFGQLLRHFRITRLLGVNELARKAQISKGAVSALENGHRTRPGFRVVRGLISALELNPEEHQLLVNAAMFTLATHTRPQAMQQEPEDVPSDDIRDYVRPEDLTKIEPAREPVVTEEEFLERARRSVQR